jgi:hypothetical protein
MSEEKSLVETEVKELKETIVKLEETVNLLQKEIWEMRYEKQKFQWSPALLKQIFGFILGAIVLIGIFWKK